jgi:hypothetical protein
VTTLDDQPKMMLEPSRSIDSRAQINATLALV